MKGSALRGAVLFAALAAAGFPRPGGAAEKDRWTLGFRIAQRYDSNVIELSDDDRGEVGEAGYENRYRISEPWDWVTEPSFSVEWSRNLLPRRATSARAEISLERHLENALLNEEEYSLDLVQEIGKERRATTSRVGLSLERSPHVTLRYLKDDDETLFAGRTIRYNAVYAKDSARLWGTAELVPRRLALDLALDREWRNYTPHFDERDGRIEGWEGRIAGWPDPKGRWRARFLYRAERYDGRGDFPGTPWTEDDLSSDRRIASADARFRWGAADRAQRVSLSWERENRWYAATSPFDFYHYGRHDRRITWEVSWRRDLPKGMAVEVRAEDERNRSDLRYAIPAVVDPGDTTSYDRWQAEAAFSWEFRPGVRASR